MAVSFIGGGKNFYHMMLYQVHLAVMLYRVHLAVNGGYTSDLLCFCSYWFLFNFVSFWLVL